MRQLVLKERQGITHTDDLVNRVVIYTRHAYHCTQRIHLVLQVGTDLMFMMDDSLYLIVFERNTIPRI